MHEIKFDPSAFHKLFFGFDATVTDAVTAAAKQKAARLLDEIYEWEPRRVTCDVLTMRQRADGVWTL